LRCQAWARFAELVVTPGEHPVAGAFDEVCARDLRKPLEISEREQRRPLYQSVNEKTMTRRIDERNAGVMNLEMQIRRRDRAGEILERRK